MSTDHLFNLSVPEGKALAHVFSKPFLILIAIMQTLVIFVNDKLPQAYMGKLSSGVPKSDGVNFCSLKGGAML